MDRPSRRTKAVNYSEAKDFEDDEDFACVKAPPNKRAKEDVKIQLKKLSQECVSKTEEKEKIRKPLDEKVYERDLEAAITLSLLNNTDEPKEHTPTNKDGKIQIPADENTDPSSLRFSNCSVDSNLMGLDTITSEGKSPALSRHRKASSKSEEEVQRKKDEDEDYRPKALSDSEDDDDDDNDFSEPESEDEEFTVKKTSRTKKKGKETPKVKAKHTPTSKKDKPASKASKTKPTAPASKTVKTPATSKTMAPKPPLSSAVLKPASPLSPVGGRAPKWNPPAQVGRSPTSSVNQPAKSPSQGLRLGLSRLVRVKPLHPGVASH